MLYVDADERVTEDLAAEIMQVVLQPTDAVAYQIRRRDFLNGKWLKHVKASLYYIRPFKPQQHIHYERLAGY